MRQLCGCAIDAPPLSEAPPSYLRHVLGRFDSLPSAAAAAICAGDHACTFCSPEAKEARDDAAKCAVCGEGNNCCGAHGSWDGACPNQHTFEDGHAACLEVMKAAGEEVADESGATTGEDTSDCMDWWGSPALSNASEAVGGKGGVFWP